MKFFGLTIEKIDDPQTSTAERDQNLIAKLRSLQSGRVKITIHNGSPTYLDVYQAVFIEGAIPAVQVTNEELTMLKLIKVIGHGVLETNINFGIWDGSLGTDTHIKYQL